MAVNIPNHGVNIPDHGVNIPDHGVNIPDHGVNIQIMVYQYSDYGVNIPTPLHIWSTSISSSTSLVFRFGGAVVLEHQPYFTMVLIWSTSISSSIVSVLCL